MKDKTLVICLILGFILLIASCTQQITDDTIKQFGSEQKQQSLENISIQTKYICNYNAYNCPDFATQSEAQKIFILCGGLNNDIHWLDGDNDEKACERLL